MGLPCQTPHEEMVFQDLYKPKIIEHCTIKPQTKPMRFTATPRDALFFVSSLIFVLYCNDKQDVRQRDCHDRDAQVRINAEIAGTALHK